MTDMDRLFPVDDTLDASCAYPDHAGTTGYRYGCRCPRCRHERFLANQPRPRTCHHPDCAALRVKHRRWCIDHIPAPSKPSRVRDDLICEVCERPYVRYDSVYNRYDEPIRELSRRVCESCRNRYTTRISKHHLSPDWAIRLITSVDCDLCGERFARKNHQALSVVDHDHHCCDFGEAISCGRCVRGIICPTCNVMLGFLETARTMGIDKLLTYIESAGR